MQISLNISKRSLRAVTDQWGNTYYSMMHDSTALAYNLKVLENKYPCVKRSLTIFPLQIKHPVL